MNEIVELIKHKDMHVPRLLITNYKKLKLSEIELIILIYLINSDTSTYNPKEISNDLDIKLNDILQMIDNLIEKGFISIDIVKINKISNEVVNLDLLYEKLAFIVINNKSPEQNDTGVFETFEKEIGRGLTPMEFEIINGWLDLDYTEELIICALKEAIYNGTTSLRYIDRILLEWHKKGIKTKEDVEKNKVEFKKKKEKNKTEELFDYDWLNEE